MWEVIAFPLFHSSLPDRESNAYSTAAPCGRPLAAANTTSLTTIGAVGAAMSREVQPGCRINRLFSSTILNATMARETGTSSHRVPSSSNMASASGANLLPQLMSRQREAWSDLHRQVYRHQDKRNAAVARRGGNDLPPVVSEMTGVVTNSLDGLENQSVGCSVFASSATTALAYPPALVVPGPIATRSLPLVVNARLPTGLPPFVFHEMTCLLSASA